MLRRLQDRQLQQQQEMLATLRSDRAAEPLRAELALRTQQLHEAEEKLRVLEVMLRKAAAPLAL